MKAQAAVGGAQHPFPPVATTLFVILKKVNMENADEYFYFCFMLFNLKIYDNIVTNLQQIACVK